MTTRIGVIGRWQLRRAFSSAETGENVTIPTPFGQDVVVNYFALGESSIAFVSRYGPLTEGRNRSAVNYRGNVYALKKVGVERIISVGSVGAINPALRVGSIVLPDDFVDFSTQRERTFFSKHDCGPFVRMNPAFCLEVRTSLLRAAARRCIPVVSRGTYVCMDGPRLETVAEIRMLRMLLCDIVGMRIATEAVLARETELCFAGVCYVTNYAEGTLPAVGTASVSGLVPQDEYLKEDAVLGDITALITSAVAEMPLTRSCVCKDALTDARQEDLLSGDWESWL